MPCTGGEGRHPGHYLLSHRAGLPDIGAPLPTEALYDWDTMTGALAAHEPWWEPGTQHGYHAFTFGWLVGEVVRRVTGKSLGTYWREDVAEPLGIDCNIGLAAEHNARVAGFIPIPPPPAAVPSSHGLLAGWGDLLDSLAEDPPPALVFVGDHRACC